MAHKKREVKYTSFLIVSDQQKEPRNIRLRNSLLKVVAGVLIAMFVLMVIGVIGYWKVAQTALENNRLSEENFKLRNSLKKVAELKEDLSKVQNYEKQLRSSLSGYVAIDNSAAQDSFDIDDIDFSKISNDKERTIFRSIPSLIPVEGFMARGFDPSLLLKDPHLGVDIAAPTGTPVLAPADGVVLLNTWTDDGGYVLAIEHGFGFLSLYKHNDMNMVGVMEKVSRGQVIALLGNTGKKTSGPHLHYELWKNGKPVDPVKYMTEAGKDNS